jgi:antitoxin HigA-1
MSTEERLPNLHPGEVILEDFLKPWGMTPYRLARSVGMTPSAIHDILNGKRAITAATALRLSAFLGCTPRFWLGLQAAYDLEEAERNPGLSEQLAQITRYPRAPQEETTEEAVAA